MAGSLSFGPFELHPGRRQLLEQGQPVRLGSRALELLIALTERAGELMSRSELESRLWPRTIVEETSLRVHVSALRKVLGDGADGARYIANVPGRGYSFVAPVQRSCGPLETANVAMREPAVGHNLPGRVARVIGRDAVSDALAAELRAGRLVSLVGAGGMGKTTVALQVARRSLAEYTDGVRLVDFAPLPAGSPVLSTLADALELQDDARDLGLVVESHLRDRRMLLVLDNCEHVVQPAAELVERLLLAAPELRILATSREALEIHGERVHRLDGLQAPARSDDQDLEKSCQLPAVQLFVERAAAAAAFELTAENLKPVCDICLQLDGMPLAIELAAVRVDALGVEGLAIRLARMFEVLTRGRRTALPRHRTLLALLDWSHELLNTSEQAVLRRLSVFRSSFPLELAASLCEDEVLDTMDVIDTMLSLVAKSLIAVDRRSDVLQYRLLYTTRGYAQEKLAASGESEAWRRRHARLICEALEAAQDETCSPWASQFAQRIEDLHAALEWTLTPDGDLDTSTRLVINAFLFWQRGGVVRNLRDSMEVVFEKLRQLPAPQPQLELRLRTALAFMTPNSSSRHTSEQLADRTLELVTEVGDTGDRIELQYALCLDGLRRADYTAALAHAHCARDLCDGPYSHLSAVLGDRLLALALYHVGDYAQAGMLTQRVLDHGSALPDEMRFSTVVPIAMSMGSMQARIHWIEGRAEQAQALCDRIMPMLATVTAVASCLFVGFTALPIALWRGDLQVALELQQLLRQHADRSANPHWIAMAPMFERAVQARLAGCAGEPATPSGPDSDLELDLLPTLVPEWVTPRALERAEGGQAGWCAPEVMRAAAEKLMASGHPADWPQARALLQRARELAISQGARAWQLRIACSQARLGLACGRPEEGRQPLADALSSLTEGLRDADARQAKQLEALLPRAAMAEAVR